MADGTRLVFRFGTASGEKNFTYKYGNSSANSSSINAAMDAMIANGSIFKFPPLTKISAKAEITTTTEFDLNS